MRIGSPISGRSALLWLVDGRRHHYIYVLHSLLNWSSFVSYCFVSSIWKGWSSCACSTWTLVSTTSTFWTHCIMPLTSSFSTSKSYASSSSSRSTTTTRSSWARTLRCWRRLWWWRWSGDRGCLTSGPSSNPSLTTVVSSRFQILHVIR